MTCDRRFIEPDAMETSFGGHVTQAVAENGRKAAFDLLGKRPIRRWTIDVSGALAFASGMPVSFVTKEN